MHKNNKKPSVTVLMTVYNGGDYLPLAIDSVLKQTHVDFEFLIVDDKSTDSSVKIIQGYHDSRIRLHCNKKNLGQTSSLNIGFDLAYGDYVARIDADDVAQKDWLEKHVLFLDSSALYDVITTDALVIDKKGRVKRYLSVPDKQSVMILRSLTASPINHGGSIMKRTTVLNMGGYDSAYRVAADFDLWSRMLKEDCQFAHNRHVGMAIRFHEDSYTLTEKKTDDLTETAQIMRENIRYYSGILLNNEDMNSFWQFIYRPNQLSLGSFLKNIEMLELMYSSIANKYCPSSIKKQFWMQLRDVVIIKRLLAFGSQGDEKNIKTTLEEINHKISSSFVIRSIKVLTFNNSFMIKMIEKCYDFKNKMFAVLRHGWIIS